MPPTTPGQDEENSRVVATPLARAVAADLGVDLATVTGSGRGGRIRRADVEAATAPAPAAPAATPAAAVAQAPVAVEICSGRVVVKVCLQSRHSKR